MWGLVTWEAKPQARPIQSSDVSGNEMLILKRILLPISLRQQQSSGSNLTFLSAHVSLCCIVSFVWCQWLYVWNSTVIGKKYNFFSEYSSGFPWFPTIVRPTLMVCGTARMHVWHTGCPGGNVPDFGRMFLTLEYTNITQNAYIQSWTVTEIMTREVWKYNSCYTLIDYQIHFKTGRISSFCKVSICT